MRDFHSFTVGRYFLFQLAASGNYLAFDPDTNFASPVRTPESLKSISGFCSVVVNAFENEMSFVIVQLGGYNKKEPGKNC
jgi:hypothetical protein